MKMKTPSSVSRICFSPMCGEAGVCGGDIGNYPNSGVPPSSRSRRSTSLAIAIRLSSPASCTNSPCRFRRVPQHRLRRPGRQHPSAHHENQRAQKPSSPSTTRANSLTATAARRGKQASKYWLNLPPPCKLMDWTNCANLKRFGFLAGSDAVF
jgi:hypothetical protein